MGRFTNLLSTLLQSQCVSRMTVTLSSDVLFLAANGGAVLLEGEEENLGALHRAIQWRVQQQTDGGVVSTCLLGHLYK